MKSIPVETANARFFIAAPPQPVTDRAGLQRADAQGRPLLQVSLVIVVEGLAAETLLVKVPAPLPSFQLMEQVRVTKLVARPWSMEGKSGVAFSAEGIVSANSKQG